MSKNFYIWIDDGKDIPEGVLTTTDLGEGVHTWIDMGVKVEKMETKKYFITTKEVNERGTVYYTNYMIDVNPFEWVVECQREFPRTKIAILFYAEISQEDYSKYLEHFE